MFLMYSKIWEKIVFLQKKTQSNLEVLVFLGCFKNEGKKAKLNLHFGVVNSWRKNIEKKERKTERNASSALDIYSPALSLSTVPDAWRIQTKWKPNLKEYFMNLFLKNILLKYYFFLGILEFNYFMIYSEHWHSEKRG